MNINILKCKSKTLCENYANGGVRNMAELKFIPIENCWKTKKLKNKGKKNINLGTKSLKVRNFVKKP